MSPSYFIISIWNLDKTAYISDKKTYVWWQCYLISYHIKFLLVFHYNITKTEPNFNGEGLHQWILENNTYYLLLSFICYFKFASIWVHITHVQYWFFISLNSSYHFLISFYYSCKKVNDGVQFGFARDCIWRCFLD